MIIGNLLSEATSDLNGLGAIAPDALVRIARRSAWTNADRGIDTTGEKSNRLDFRCDLPETVGVTARIYQRPKSTMQSGRARTGEWLLEFAPAEARRADPLMGWAGSGDTQSQVALQFASQAEAQAYADQIGLTATVHPTPPRRLKLQAYADNFR